jgi:hypothetical protein
VTNDPLKGRRAKLICEVADVAFKAKDTKVVSWCKSQNDFLFENLGRVRVDIEFWFSPCSCTMIQSKSLLKSDSHPIHMQDISLIPYIGFYPNFTNHN